MPTTCRKLWDKRYNRGMILLMLLRILNQLTRMERVIQNLQNNSKFKNCFIFLNIKLSIYHSPGRIKKFLETLNFSGGHLTILLIIRLQHREIHKNHKKIYDVGFKIIEFNFENVKSSYLEY